MYALGLAWGSSSASRPLCGLEIPTPLIPSSFFPRGLMAVSTKSWVGFAFVAGLPVQKHPLLDGINKNNCHLWRLHRQHPGVSRAGCFRSWQGRDPLQLPPGIMDGCFHAHLTSLNTCSKLSLSEGYSTTSSGPSFSVS